MALNKPLGEGTRPFKMHRSVIIYQPSSGARTPKSLPSPDPPTSVTETQRQGVWGRTELTLYRIILLNHSAFSCPSLTVNKELLSPKPRDSPPCVQRLQRLGLAR